MKLALYLPNFRTKVTLKELEDLTSLAEDLDFDSVWTLDRIVVPEASDRAELQYSFGMMAGLPKALPVASRGEWFQGMPLIPWLAAKTTQGADRDEHHRHAVPRPRRPRRRDGDDRPPVGRPAQRRRRLRLDARGVRGRERRAHLPPAAHARARDDRGHAGHLGRTTCSSTTASSPTSSRCGFGVKPLQQPAADLLQRAQGPEALGAAHREVQPGGLDRDPGLAGGHQAVARRHPARAGGARAAPVRWTTSRSAA